MFFCLNICLITIFDFTGYCQQLEINIRSVSISIDLNTEINRLEDNVRQLYSSLEGEERVAIDYLDSLVRLFDINQYSINRHLNFSRRGLEILSEQYNNVGRDIFVDLLSRKVVIRLANERGLVIRDQSHLSEITSELKDALRHALDQ